MPDLLKWAKGKGFHLATVPPLDDYDYAQAEYVLSLIANSPLYNSTADEAAAHVATNPILAQHPAAKAGYQWLAGAYAGEQWHEVISKAIANSELVLLDRYSLLPVAIAAAPAKEEAVQRSITKQQVINAFDGLCFDRNGWNNALSDVPQWIEPCRVTLGRKGDKTNPATWNPVLIAAALIEKRITAQQLDAVFVRLKDWADEWREVSASFRD